MMHHRRSFTLVAIAASLLVAGAAMAAVTSTYSYDPLGRVTNVTDSNSNTTAYSYDSLGNRTAVTRTTAVSTLPTPSNRIHPNAAGTGMIDTGGGSTLTFNANITFPSSAGAPTAFPYVWSATNAGYTVRAAIGNSTLAKVSYVGWANPNTVSVQNGILAEGRTTQVNAAPILSMQIFTDGHPRLSGFGVSNLIDSGITVTAGTWFFWAVTIGDDPVNTGKFRARLYINGLLQGAGVDNLTQRDLGATRIISSMNETSDAPASNTLRGLQQEWRIYAGTELSPAEIAALYSLGRAGL